MKIIQKIKNMNFSFQDKKIYTNKNCSLVGNSGCLLDNHYGEKIDSNADVIRFNNARIDGFEPNVGTKKSFRILNCHFILNIDNEKYFMDQKRKHPNMDRYMLYSFKNENLIFKTDPSWKLWNKRDILNKVEQNNNVYFVDEGFYNLGKKMNSGKEPTNGFMGLLFALKYYDNIECFGFSFYKEGVKKHYYEEVLQSDQHLGHDFDTEQRWFRLLEKNNLIKICR